MSRVARTIMSHTQVETQGNLNYPTSTLIESSKDLGWSNLFAELRSYSRCEGPGTAAAHAEVAIAIGGSDEGLITCKVDGSWRPVRPTTGTIWFRPIGAHS